MSDSNRLRSGATKLLAARTLPWLVMLQAGAVAGKRWNALSSEERARLARLLRDSGGRVGNLSRKQRAELNELVGKLDLKGLGRDLLPLVRGARRKGA